MTVTFKNIYYMKIEINEVKNTSLVFKMVFIFIIIVGRSP